MSDRLAGIRVRVCGVDGNVPGVGLVGVVGLILYVDAERDQGLDGILEQLAKDRSGELNRELATGQRTGDLHGPRWQELATIAVLPGRHRHPPGGDSGRDRLKGGVDPTVSLHGLSVPGHEIPIARRALSRYTLLRAKATKVLRNVRRRTRRQGETMALWRRGPCSAIAMGPGMARGYLVLAR
jgi:hypothetical protein